MNSSITVVVLAAGLGTRMKSKKAKVLHRAGGRSLIEHVVETAGRITAADSVFVVVGHQAELVEAAVRPRGVQTILQPEQKGTGHALMMCRERLSGRSGLFVILYGDCPLLSAATLEQLLARHRQSGAAATVITTTLDDPTGYGRVIEDAQGNVRAIVEQKAATAEQLAVREINSGIYCFDSEALWKHLDEIRPDNPVREYYLTDLVEIFTRCGYRVAAFHLDDSSEVLGINTRAELALVDQIFRTRTVQRLMLEGVTIEKPETVTIDPQVSIGRDTIVEPFAQILGDTAIGEDCQIGACSIIRDSRLEDRVEVGPFTIVGASHIEKDAAVGPYARLRFDNRVEAGAHVGNFVELKKTRLGAGAKSMHLAYLGDSDIGANVNVGAGTITCNYDGVKKHRTEIGEGAFIGSNATLVAPVRIGDGAYVGAASVITDPVPADSLALGRARQVVKEGWARKRRQAAGK